jgi:hypothetical protein
VAVASKKKREAEAGNTRKGKAEEPVEAEPAGKKNAKAVKAAKKTVASKNTAGKKTSKKKAAGKKTASKKTASKKKAAPVAGARRNPSHAAGYAAIDAAPAVGVGDPFEVAKQTMKGSVSAIVEALVAQAKRGSCAHAKTLLEMTGAKHMFGDAAETEDRGEPWAKLVLERMDEAEQESRKTDLPEVAAE